MIKIYAPLGYTVDYRGRDYYNGDDHEELVAAVMGLANWDQTATEKILSSDNKELIKMLTDNGFELIKE